MSEDENLKARLRKLTDSVVEPPTGEMAVPYTLALAQADKLVALTALLPASFATRALLGPFPDDEPERERMWRRRDAVRSLLLGGERRSGMLFLQQHAAPMADAIEAVAVVARALWTAGSSDRSRLDAVIHAGGFGDELDSDTLALLVFFQCGELIEAPIREVLEPPAPLAADLERALERRTALLALLSASFLARPVSHHEGGANE